MSCLNRCSVAAWAIAASCVPVTLRAAGPELQIAVGDHIQFQPAPGTAWYIEGSNGEAWETLAGPLFADGGTIDQLVPAGKSKRNGFRLRYVDPATVGLAPVSMADRTVIAWQDARPIEIVFLNAQSGFMRINPENAGTFTYTWKKTAPDRAEGVLTAVDGAHLLLRLTFSGAAAGRWEMQSIVQPGHAAIAPPAGNAGAFVMAHGRISRREGATTLPLDLSGREVVFNEGGRVARAVFADRDRGSLVRADGVAVAFNYSYDPATNTNAGLHLDFPGDSVAFDFQLDMLSPAGGTFTKQLQSPAGAPLINIPSTSGSFGTPPPPSPPSNAGCPPADLNGRALRMSGSRPFTLVFNNDGTGHELCDQPDGVEVTPFSYDYSPNGDGGANLTITYPGAGGDSIDDYELNFDPDCNGEYSCENYDDGASTGGDSGTFGPATPPAIVFDAGGKRPGL